MSLRAAISQGKWANLAPMPLSRSHFGVAVFAERIYVFGGGGEGFKSLNAAHVYDIQKDTWEAIQPMPTLRSGVVAVPANGRVFVMGGGYRLDDGTFNFLKTVEIYDPQADTWEQGPYLLERHDAPCATLYKEEIFLFGGHHPEAQGGPLTDPATNFSEQLSLEQGSWQKLVSMPTPRFSLSAVAYGDKIWAMGGGAFKAGEFQNFDLIEVYDPLQKTWSESFALPWPSAGLGSCVMGGRVYVRGGNNGKFIQDCVACHDPQSGTWTSLSPMNFPRAAMGLVTVGGKLFALGGRGVDGKIPVATMEVFSPEG